MNRNVVMATEFLPPISSRIFLLERVSAVKQTELSISLELIKNIIFQNKNY